MAFALLLVILISSVAIIAFAGPHTCGNPSSGPVLGGVDLVLMRTEFEANHTFANLPYLGSKEIRAEFGGYQFWFQSSSNQEAFMKSPEAYIPQLGGYCSWGLTGYDIHVSDPSGYMLAGSCVNSTKGFSFLKSAGDWQNFWYLKYEAKYDMEKTGVSVDANIEAARGNFAKILTENSVDYCFNTELIRTCK